MNSEDFEILKEKIREFVRLRNMQATDTPKNLAMALCVEAAELLEPFQWLKSGERAELNEERYRLIQLEIADVLIYLIALSDKLGIDIVKVAHEKMQINETKYPIAEN